MPSAPSITGEDLYAFHCAELRKLWVEPDGILYAVRASQPPAKPLAWAFLTPVEQGAWDNLARRCTVDGFHCGSLD